jgi:hypothetical protein
LLIVLLTGAVYALSRAGSVPSARVSTASGKPAAAAASASNSGKATAASTPPAPQKTMPEALELDKLDSAGEPSETTRNPFRFGVKPTPPTPPVAVRPTAPAAPPGPPPPPPIPPVPLKFIGRMVLDKQIIAVLSDTKGTVFRAIEGQVVDGRYRVVKIGEESLIIEYVNGTGRMTLPLRGS